MDLSSRLRAIVKAGRRSRVRELTYEPDDGTDTRRTLDLPTVSGIARRPRVLDTPSAAAWSSIGATRRTAGTAVSASAMRRR